MGPNEIGQFTPDDLFAGDFPVIRQTIVLEGGQLDLKRGTVLAEKTNNKWVLVEVGGADDADKPKGILAGDATADGADTKVTVFRTGEFNREALIFKAGDDPTQFIKDMESLMIWVRASMPIPQF